MKRNCPKTHCQSDQFYRHGSFKRANDSRTISRFRCKKCGTTFSTSTGTLEYRQKKRRVNILLFRHFISKTSIRESARLVGVNKNTAARKFDYWCKKAEVKNKRFRERLKKNKATYVQFDDLLSKEKTKLKPLSISVISDAKRRYILGAKVSVIPSFGHLAKISRSKYGMRYSQHKKTLDELMQEMKEVIDPFALIKSDEHKSYHPIVRKYFKYASYYQYKSQRACVAGQGELKRKGYDPIFYANHNLAILRDKVSTLVRRTWCVTQDPKRLQGHLEMAIYYYNQIYLKKKNGSFSTA